MKKIIVSLAFLTAGMASQAMASSTTALADWCMDLNGDINVACNGAGGGGAGAFGGSVSLSSFDATLEPGTNILGTVVFTLNPGQNNQYVGFYADYDLDNVAYGTADDSASVHGTAPSGVSYEANDPNVSNIFNDFSGLPTALPDSNSVGTPSGPPTVCCDVAFAMGVTGLNVAAGGTGTVTFTISTTLPTGFYIQQTNTTAGDSIYLSEVTTITAPAGGGGGVPEPSTFALGLGALGAVVAVTRRKRARA